MKNPKTPQPDLVSSTLSHEGIRKPMNDPMATDSSDLDTDKLTNSEESIIDALTDTNSIDPDNLIDEVHSGLTEVHRHNIDESRIDEVLVEDTLDDKHYPTIRDIADEDAVAHSFEDE